MSFHWKIRTMIPKKAYIVFLFFVAVFVSGCVATPEKKPETSKAPPAPKKVSKEGPVEKFYKNQLKEAQSLKENGNLVESLRKYKIAATLQPQNQELLECIRRLEAELQSKAESHYKTGLEFQKEGKYGKARREFLVAMRLRPDYPEVKQIFTSRKRIKTKRYIVHKIKPGESLSKVAKRYYDDYKKFSIIARYNNLTDATVVHVGQEIKIPEIDGLEFHVDNINIRTEQLAEGSPGIWEMGPQESTEGEEPSDGDYAETEKEPLDQLSIYQQHGVSLYNQGLYREALIEFKKVLCERPEDEVSNEYIYKCYYQMALEDFKNKDYLAAKENFESSLLYRKGCQKCHAYIKKSEGLFKEIHYKKGIQHYGKQELVKAIDEWKLVKVIDPDYKRVEYYINKALAIMKKLEELKKQQR